MSKRTHAPSAGYSADTEILTRQGWVTFDRLTYFDEIATRTPEGRFEWQAPDAITWKPYSGEMAWLHSRSVDLQVVPGHPVLWMPDARGSARVSPAADILARKVTRARQQGFTFARSEWDAADLQEKILPGIRRSKMGPCPRDVRMTGDQFAAYMGMYIAEGSCTHSPSRCNWGITIAQTASGKGYREYRDLLVSIFGREPGGDPGLTWVMTSRPLFEYLAPLGKAVSKYLPAEVMNLSRRQLQIFWDYYFLGDGSYEVREGRTSAAVGATASKVLAGQLQEIVQKLGASAAVCVNKVRATPLVRTEGIIYKVRIRGTVLPSFTGTSIPYSGFIGHVRVPSGVTYVRRSGKPAWCC